MSVFRKRKMQVNALEKSLLIGFGLLLCQVIMCFTVQGCAPINEKLPVWLGLATGIASIFLFLKENPKTETTRVKTLSLLCTVVFCSVSVYTASDYWKGHFVSRLMLDSPNSAD